MKKISDLFLELEKYLYFLAMAVLLFFVFMATVCRYCHLPWPYWSEELSRVLMVWLALLGGGSLVRTGEHFTVDAVLSYMPRRGQQIMLLAVWLIVELFGAVIAYFGIVNCIKVSGMGQLSPALQIPMWMLYAVVPLTGISICIQSIPYYFPFVTGKRRYESETDTEKEKMQEGGGET